MLGFNNSHMEITGGTLPEDIWGIYLTENAGTFFGVGARRGRNIEPSDAEDGGRSVVVLNYRFWQRYYGGDPSAMSICRAASCSVWPTFAAKRTYRGSGSGPMSRLPPPTRRSSHFG